MRILIVNGYKKGHEGLKKFSEFQYAIMKVKKEILNFRKYNYKI
jgi:hypothetical protein